MATSSEYQPPVRGYRKQQKLNTGTKPVRKGSTMNNVSASPSDIQAQSSDVEDETGEDASSCVEEMDDDSGVEEPDAIALSDAQKWDSMNHEHRLAGLETGDTFMDDVSPTVAGASTDQEGISEDDEYAGVEDLSDGEESVGDSHDKNVLRSAEQDLIEEFEHTEERHNANDVTADMGTMFLQDDAASARQLGLASNDVFEEVFGPLDMNEDPFHGLPTHDDLYQDLHAEAETALALWRQTRRHNSADSAETKKRVRFAEPQETPSSSSSMSSSEDPSDAFPDLFADRDDATLKSRYAVDVDTDASFRQDYSDAGSCYDFDGDEERLALEIDDEDSDTEDGSDSINSEDEGDTTDEETEEEQTARLRAIRKAAARSPRSAPRTPTPANRPVSRIARAQSSPLSTPRSGKGPRMGSFVVDKARATMSADCISNHLTVLPPSNPSEKEKAFWDRARTAANSRSSTPRSSAYWSMRGPVVYDVPQRPFTAHSTLGSMFNGNLDILRNNDVSGIAGNLFPGVYGRPNSSFSSATMTEDSEAELPEVNMDEFLKIDDLDPQSDEPFSGNITSPSQPDFVDTITSVDSGRNEGLLSHLDQQRGLVGSFRRNQDYAKHISSLAANPAERASASEYNALQKGRRAAANTPITPARKKRTSQDMSLSLTGAGVRKAVSNPLAGRRPRSRGASLSGINHMPGPSIMQ